jgi:hypothetical protein
MNVYSTNFIYTKPNYHTWYLELDSKYKVECSGGLWQIISRDELNIGVYLHAMVKEKDSECL